MHLSRFPSLWQPLQFIRTTVRWRMDSPASLQAQLVSLGNPWDRGTVLASASMQQEGTDEYKASVDTEHKQPPLPPAVPHNLFTRRYQPPLITQAMGQACFRVGQLMAEQADTRGVKELTVDIPAPLRRDARLQAFVKGLQESKALVHARQQNGQVVDFHMVPSRHKDLKARRDAREKYLARFQSQQQQGQQQQHA